MKNKLEIIPTEKKYQWGENFANPIAHTDVSEVIEELDIIQEINGRITPQLVVDNAKNKKSVLHTYFQWDNEKAANNYRLQQAGRLLRNIQIVTITDGSPKTIRAFEIIKKEYSGEIFTASYKPAHLLSIQDHEFVIKMILADLYRIEKKLIGLSYNEAAELITSVIKILSKESTETKEEGKLLIGLGTADVLGSVAEG